MTSLGSPGDLVTLGWHWVNRGAPWYCRNAPTPFWSVSHGGGFTAVPWISTSLPELACLGFEEVDHQMRRVHTHTLGGIHLEEFNAPAIWLVPVQGKDPE